MLVTLDEGTVVRTLARGGGRIWLGGNREGGSHRALLATVSTVRPGRLDHVPLPSAIHQVTSLTAYRNGVLVGARRAQDSLLMYVEPNGARTTVARTTGFLYHISAHAKRFAAVSDRVGRRSALLVGSTLNRATTMSDIPEAVNQVFALEWVDAKFLVVAGQHLESGAPVKASVLISRDSGRHWRDNTPTRTLSDFNVDVDGRRLLLAKMGRGERTATLVQQELGSTVWQSVDPSPLPFADRVDIYPTPDGYWLSGLNLYWLPRTT